MDKRHYFLRKIANTVLTIVVVASFNFVLFRILPGDPARLLLPRGRWDAASITANEKAFHLDKPLWEQFGYYWWDTVRFRFGDSFKARLPVTQVVGERILPTLLLTGTGMVFAILIGVITGVFGGWRRGSLFDTTATGVSMVFYSTPTLWVGMILIGLFSVKLGWFPTGGLEEAGAVYASWWQHTKAILDHLFLPALTFCLVYIGQYHIIMRSSITGVIKEDFVLTARAKGMSNMRVLWHHVFRNALLPTFTLIMINLGLVMSGAILTETVFNWPGLGRLAYDSMMQRDYPVMQAVFLLMSVAVIFANLIADFCYYYLDPRVQA